MTRNTSPYGSSAAAESPELRRASLARSNDSSCRLCAGPGRRRVGPPPTRRVAAARSDDSAAAAEVETVDLHIAGVVGFGQCHDQRLQCRRLARPRATHDGDIPCRTGQLRDQQVPTLLEGAIHEADRHGERDASSGPLQQTAERGRIGQRRQPHLMRGRPTALELIEDGVEHGSAGAGGVVGLLLVRLTWCGPSAPR